MQATLPLALLNVATGDIQGGLGPFLATYLSADGHWGPARIGVLTTTVGLAALVLNGPAGLLADRTRRPAALLAGSSLAIAAGTLLVLFTHALAGVMLAQAIAAAGGAALLPMLTLLTLGTVGKKRFPRQQGVNQACNHAGIVAAALLISGLAPVLGVGVAFWVLAGMGLAAAAIALLFPRGAFDVRRAHGWREDGSDTDAPRHAMGDVLRNRRLLLLAAALGLYNLSNGSMLALAGQRLVASGNGDPRWVSLFVVTAQATMIPVALAAGRVADRGARRRLLLLACAVTPVRAALSAFVSVPALLVPAEMLDGVAAGLIGVAVPIMVADVTWGSGRTQTALGALNTLQGVGGALSGVFAGLLARRFGWEVAFLGLGAPALLATGVALWLGETQDADPRRRERAERSWRGSGTKCSVTQRWMSGSGCPRCGWR